MKILDIINQDDGSAILKIDIDDEEMRLLMEVGLNKVLTDYMVEFEKKLKEGKDVSNQNETKGS